MDGSDVQTVVASPMLVPMKLAPEDNAVTTPVPMVCPTVVTAAATAVPTVLAAAPTVVPAAAAMSGAPAAAAVVAAASYTQLIRIFTKSDVIGKVGSAYGDDSDTRR